MTVSFEFVGGLMDGQKLSNASTDASESRRAACYYCTSEKGRVGARFAMALEPGQGRVGTEVFTPMLYARQRDSKHYYEIADRLEKDGSVHLRAVYVGRGPK